MLEDEWSRWLAISAADNGGNMENKNICQLMDKISLLKGAAIFNGMPANYLAAVAEIAEERTLFAGETLFKQGDFGDSLYVVIEGSLSVLAGEKEQARLPAGECIGEMALLDGNPRSASVRAASDARLLRKPKLSGDFWPPSRALRWRCWEPWPAACAKPPAV
jgi:hypothetical protein